MIAVDSGSALPRCALLEDIGLIDTAAPKRSPEADRNTQASALAMIRAHRIDALTIGEFCLDIGALKCTGPDQQPKRLTLKTMNVLLELALRPNETLTREELLDAVWPDTCPTPEVLTQAIKELRKLFADDQKAPAYIETIPKIGYRLLQAPAWQRIALAEPLADEASQIVNPDRATTLSENVANQNRTHTQISDAQEAQSIIQLTPSATPYGARSRTLVLFLTIFAILGSAMLWQKRQRANAPQQQDARMLGKSTNDTPAIVRMLTSAPGVEHSPSISANAAWLSYVSVVDGRQRIWVRNLSAPKAERLTKNSPDNAQNTEVEPQFSSDGSEIAFIQFAPAADQTERCTLMAQYIVGGTPRKLMDCPNNTGFSYQWSSANEIIYTQSRTAIGAETPIAEIVSFDLTTGQTKHINPEQRKEWLVAPKRSPDGQYIVARRSVGSSTVLVISDALGNQARELAPSGEQGFAWMPDSKSLIASVHRDGNYELAQIGIDGSQRWLGTKGRQPSVGLASDGARVVFTREQVRENLVEFDLADTSTLTTRTLFASSDVDNTPSISANGRLLSFLSGRGGFDQVWIGELSAPTRSSPSPDEIAPIAVSQTVGRMSRIDFSPDSQYLVFAQLPSGELISKFYEYDIAAQRLHEFPAPAKLGVIIRVAYDAEHLLILSGKASKRILQRWRPNKVVGGIDANQWQLDWSQEGVMSFRRDPVTNRFFFVKAGSRALFERTIDGQEQLVLAQPDALLWIWSWYVYGDKLYALADLSEHRSLSHAKTASGIALVEHDLSSGKVRIVQHLDVDRMDDFALDLTARRMVLSTRIQYEADIGSLVLPIASQH